MNWIFPFIAALLLTLSNAFKPIVVDDPAYVRLAYQIIKTPLEPYGSPPLGFETIWYQQPQPAFTILAPPVFPYYLATAIYLFGDNASWWKLTLFPLCWLLTGSIFFLAKKWIPSRERELLVLITFSPVMLPSLNLMLDIPALAFGLSALACFVHGIDTNEVSWRWIVLGGFLLGFALQTKYNSLTIIGLIGIWGCFQRKCLPTLITILISIFLFLSWECYVGWIYGDSHFWYHFAHRQAIPSNEATSLGFVTEKRANLIIPLLTHLGALAGYLLLLGLTTRWVHRATICLGAIYIFILFSPSEWQVILRHPTGEEQLTLRGLLFLIFGLLLLLSILIRWMAHFKMSMLQGDRSIGMFLLSWVILELLIAWLMSPFAASRRLIGSITAITFLIGFFWKEKANWKYGITLSIILGFFLAVSDAIDAYIEKEVVEELHQAFDGIPPTTTIWFCGHWGFSYYAERAGMKRLFPNRSILKEGDWLIVPDKSLRPATQKIQLPESVLEKWEERVCSSRWPIRTIPEFYGGKIPFRPWWGPRMKVEIFRVRKDFLARTPQ